MATSTTQRQHADVARQLEHLADAEADQDKAAILRQAALHVKQAGELLWTTAQCAAHCGVAAATWRYYVNERGAPGPIARAPGRGGQSLYDPEAVQTWHAQRRGRGYRSDLPKKQ